MLLQKHDSSRPRKQHISKQFLISGDLNEKIVFFFKFFQPKRRMKVRKMFSNLPKMINIAHKK